MHRNGLNMEMPSTIEDFDILTALPTDFSRLSIDTIQSGANNHSIFEDELSALVNAFSLFAGSKLNGIVGWRVLWRGVAEFWYIWEKEAFDLHRQSMIEVCKFVNEEFSNEHNIWRLQSIVSGDLLCQWLKDINFSCESTLEGYCPTARDAYMYSLVNEANLPSEG